ncbi:hypothetical protein NA57DRAFT_77301 [Rhizodiscina lignyota]|uniref:Ribonucleases P/MRP subunit Pop8-like domain-containing protein n=1 Tax=Rhizodiscina lignyota TaxID=1504668 RepID=A0A9P4M4M0_9PEZI|nr:hypothetical protein NA57DRAFT_77301 [Rhizodiscina lignyota]
MQVASDSAPPDSNPPANETVLPTKRRLAKSTTVLQYTLRKPQWEYLHLSLHRSPPFSSTDDPLDALTARTHLTSSLQQFLGITGTAIPIDILKLEGHDVWVRVPREDASSVVVAVGGWASVQPGEDGESVTLGWRVKSRDEWLSRLAAGDEMDLFNG